MEVGLHPKNLANAPIPKCSGCMFAAMKENPWRSKGSKTGGKVARIIKINRHGQCVSINMLDSLNAVFISHMKVQLTKKRYKYATVFVDHFSDLKYVHCVSEITSEKNIYSKKSF